MPIDRKSRYANAPTVVWTRPDGSQVELIAQTPRPRRTAVFSTVVVNDDRLDRLAARYYRDPTRLWKIADASDQPDPFDVIEPGLSVDIPPDK